MKKKLFAILSAAALGMTALCAPASAESTYQKGDINMDGSVTVEDAQLALNYYVWSLANLWLDEESPLTEEQIELGSIYGEEWIHTAINKIEGKPKTHICRVTCKDAQAILNYYTMHLAQYDVTMEEIIWKEK